MKGIPSYNKKWLIYILSFFLFFAVVMIVSEYFHEKKIRIHALNEELGNYSDIIDKYATRYNMAETGYYTGLDTLRRIILKDSLRITMLDNSGNVLFDSEVRNNAEMGNHLQRPEIQSALNNSFGTDIRVSTTTGTKYYYYAKCYTNFIVRVSEVFTINTMKFIQPDRIFLLFIIFLFLLGSFTIVLLTDRFGKSISTLRKFTIQAIANKPIDEKMDFPENELGEIGQEIIDIYRNLNRAKEELLSEKAKLIRHLNILDEGIAIYSKERRVVTCNNNFIRFINHISDARIFTPDEFFRVQEFSPLFTFLDKYLKDDKVDLADMQPTYEITLNKNGKFFSMKCILFQDKSFEVLINDITKPAKRKLMKQQMTENIAHELKTPVSSIKGFLETLLQGKTDKARMSDYLQRAYVQSCRLSDLINDISLLTKIEEAGSLYQIEKVNLKELIEEIADEMQYKLEENKIRLKLKIPESLSINGNPVLLYSVFRNLFDNTVDHAGGELQITLDNYTEDGEYYYFSFSDTGKGVPVEDLPRLFERFYRVDKGRDRKKGGTGLGLAIVKNAIQFHKGDISVKNHAGGGLEFLFSLAKDIRGSNE